MTEPIRVGDKVQWMHTFLYQTKRLRKGTVIDAIGSFATVQPFNKRTKSVTLYIGRLTRLDAAEPASPRATDEGGGE